LLLQRRDALFQRRMGHEQALQARTHSAGNTESGHPFRQRRRFVLGLEALQRGDHGAPPGQRRTAAVSAELALAREPHDDDRGENPEHHLGDDHGDEERRALTAFCFEHDLVHQMAE